MQVNALQRVDRPNDEVATKDEDEKNPYQNQCKFFGNDKSHNDFSSPASSNNLFLEATYVVSKIESWADRKGHFYIFSRGFKPTAMSFYQEESINISVTQNINNYSGKNLGDRN